MRARRLPAPSRGSTQPSLPGLASGLHSLALRGALAAAILTAGAACTRQNTLPDEAPDIQVSLGHNPTPAAIGEGELTLTFFDSAGQRTSVSRLSLKADMTHPGMPPWLAEIDMQNSSQASIPVTWTMAGDWVVQIEAELSDGRRLRRTLATRIEPPDPR